MLSELASVASHDGLSLQLRTGRQTSCSACSLKAGCGQYLLARQEALLELESCSLDHELLQGGLRPGERVRICLAEGQLLLLAGLFYGLPLACLLISTLLAFCLRTTEQGLILAALAGLLVGFVLSRSLMRSSHLQKRFSPQIRRETGTASAPVQYDGSQE